MQIAHAEGVKEGVFSSFLQMRGSIPTFWTQESSISVPKPPIVNSRVDPMYSATQVNCRFRFNVGRPQQLRSGSVDAVLDLELVSVCILSLRSQRRKFHHTVQCFIFRRVGRITSRIFWSDMDRLCWSWIWSSRRRGGKGRSSLARNTAGQLNTSIPPCHL